MCVLKKVCLFISEMGVQSAPEHCFVGNDEKLMLIWLFENTLRIKIMI